MLDRESLPEQTERVPTKDLAGDLETTEGTLLGPMFLRFPRLEREYLMRATPK
jgi:hypothetical protein